MHHVGDSTRFALIKLPTGIGTAANGKRGVVFLEAMQNLFLMIRSMRTRLLLISLAVSLGGAVAEAVPLPLGPTRPGADSGPTRVEIAAWFADIWQFDSATQSFSASLVLVIRWYDPALAHAGPGVRTYPIGQVWHPQWLIINEGAAMKRTFQETVNVTPNGDVIYRQRLIGSFQQPLNLRRFPFDQAVFRVELVVTNARPGEIELGPAASAVAAGLPQGVGHAQPLTIQDWVVTSVGAGPNSYTLTPGNELVGYGIEFAASRRPQHYLLKVILPLLLILFMSWAVFWIDPTMGASQISVAVTSVLTLIAYRFAIGNEVPKLPYLTLLDSLILLATILVFLSLVEVIATTALSINNRIETARAVDRYARWAFPLTFVLLGATCIFW